MNDSELNPQTLIDGLTAALDKTGDEKDKIIRATIQYILDHANLPKEEDIGRLTELLVSLVESLVDEQEFNTGDLVVWKSGLKNRRRPLYGEPVVVVEFQKDGLRHESTDSGSPYFREPLDLAIAILDNDQELLIYHVDPRRFEKYQG